MCSSIMRAISSIETAADALAGIASSRSARSAPGCAHGWWCADDAGAGPPLAAAAVGLGTSEMGVKAGAVRPRMPPRAAAAAVVARPAAARSAALPRTRAASSSCRSAARAPGWGWGWGWG